MGEDTDHVDAPLEKKIEAIMTYVAVAEDKHSRGGWTGGHDK
ncbi:MAG: hypothetical protein OHK005_01780 [Candidatus Methylacidiphilales bacterium]